MTGPKIITNKLITPGQVMQPRIVSFDDLQKALLPMCVGMPWAQSAIRDLWLLGAPVPQPEGAPERRILLPGKFAQWWGEVQQRMGLELAPQLIYPTHAKGVRSHAGLQR